MDASVGILAIGTFLPEQVRRNDWWPQSVLDEWAAKKARNVARADRAPSEDMPLGLRRTLAALQALDGDPFQGALERRGEGAGDALPGLQSAPAPAGRA